MKRTLIKELSQNLDKEVLLKGWVQEFERAGLKVVHKESYLLDWLRTRHWEKDVRLEVKTGRGWRPTDYPHSTMLIVGGR